MDRRDYARALLFRRLFVAVLILGGLLWILALATAFNPLNLAKPDRLYLYAYMGISGLLFSLSAKTQTSHFKKMQKFLEFERHHRPPEN